MFTLSQLDLKLPACSLFSFPDTALYWASGWIYIPRGHLCAEGNMGNDFNRQRRRSSLWCYDRTKRQRLIFGARDKSERAKKSERNLTRTMGVIGDMRERLLC